MRKFTTPIQTVQQLAVNIHDARKAAGLSQEELAGKTGLSRSWITRLETGKIANPGFNDVLSVYKALHISDSISYRATDLEPEDDKSKPVSSPQKKADQQTQPSTLASRRLRNLKKQELDSLPKKKKLSDTALKDFKFADKTQKSVNNILKEMSQRAAESSRQASRLNNPDSLQPSQ